MISQMILGFMLESLLGPMRVAAIYFASDIGGNIFSALCNPSKYESVGASTALFGFIGTLISIVVVNWKAFDRSPELRCFMIIMITFILLFSLISILGDTSDPVSKVASTSVDGYGHLGGLLTGFCFSAYMMVHLRGAEARAPGSWEQKCKLVGFGLFVFQMILYFTLFFALPDLVPRPRP
jgi:membrane associated rhomboid family serine protease